MKQKQYTYENGVKLTTTHKYLFEQLIKLAHQKGYCWAKNENLAEWFDMSKSRISHILTDLRRAGLISIQCIYKKGTKFVEERRIAICHKLSHNLTNHNATHSKEQSLDCNVNKTDTRNASTPDDSPKEAPIKTLMETAIKLGINTGVVFSAKRTYGLKYVQEKMAIVANSRSVTNPIAYFLKALKDDWKPNKRAAKKVDSPCDYSRIVTYTVNYQNHDADAIIKTRSLDAIASDPNSAWLAKFIK